MEKEGFERKQFRECWGKYYRSKEVGPYLRSLENQFQGSERRVKKLKEELDFLQQTLESRDQEIQELKEHAQPEGAETSLADELMQEARLLKEEAEKQLAEVAAREEALLLGSPASETEDGVDARLAEFETRLGSARQRAEAAESRAAIAEQRVEEVEALLQEAGKKEKELLRRVDELTVARQTIIREADDGKEDRILALTEEVARLRQAQSTRSEDTQMLSELRTSLEQANERNRALRARVSQMQGELDDYKSRGDSTGEAQERAKKIIQDAVEQSNEIMESAERIRTRAFAAAKAAYFNTLLFRQQLADQFTNIQEELDSSLGILSAPDMLALSQVEKEQAASEAQGKAKAGSEKKWE